MELAGNFKLLPECLFGDTYTHGRKLVALPGYRVPDKNITVKAIHSSAIFGYGFGYLIVIVVVEEIVLPHRAHVGDYSLPCTRTASALYAST